MLQTPCILVDKGRLMENVERFQKIGTLYYPVKANAWPEILRLLAENGSCFNVSAVRYLELLMELGVGPERILWDNCFCSDEELDAVIRQGVKLFTVDSMEGFAYIREHSPAAKFLVRINNELVGESDYKYGSMDPAVLIAAIGPERLQGVSFHLGKGLFDHESLGRMLAFVAGLGNFDTLNVGGGYEDFFADPQVPAVLEQYRQAGVFRHALFEPGRGLLNCACRMVTRVLAVREHHGQKWAKIDASIYSGLMDVHIEHKQFHVHDDSAEQSPCLVMGNTPDSADTLGVQMLSSRLKPGDLLTIDRCGAYSYDMSCRYSGAKQLGIRFCGE